VLFRTLKRKRYIKIDLKHRQAKQAHSVTDLCCNVSTHTYTFKVVEKILCGLFQAATERIYY